MEHIHVFHIIGSVAFALTGLLHVAVALTIGSAGLSMWLPLYAVWLVFMGLGLGLSLRKRHEASETARA